MKAADLEKLRRPYPPEEQTQEGRFARALGLSIQEVTSLQDDIFSDLDEDKLGIGWWAPYPDDARRILISDHLYMCVTSIHTNLIEAKLHFLELEHAWQQHSELFADTLARQRGRFFFRRPPVASPADDLSLRLTALHTAGFFRAIGGTLDCLGATMIGVAALRRVLLKSDLKSARGGLPTVANSEGDALQLNLKNVVDTGITELGPPGWLTWATDYRNMLVHRARLAETSELITEESPIRDYFGRRIIRTKTMPRLVKDPGRSEVEVLFHATAPTLVLSEHARDTLDVTLTSTAALVQRIAAELLNIWRTRRNRPNLLRQPKEQWAAAPSEETAGFDGYRPGSKPYRPSAMFANPIFATRLKAAALSDQQRHRWETFGK